MISVSEIEQRLRDQAESLGRRLLPGSQRQGNYLVAGSVMGEAGTRLVLYLSGERKGLWRDYVAGDFGDMLDLIGATQGYAGKGEAVAFAKQFLGIQDDFRPGAPAPDAAEMARRAEALRVQREAQAARDAQDRAAKIRGAKALYLDARSDIAGTPAEAYLLGRGLALPEKWPGALRFHPDVWSSEARVKGPAMLAPLFLIVNDRLEQVAVHITYLERGRHGWTKAPLKLPKIIRGPMWGASVPINTGSTGKRLCQMPVGEPIYVTEGIEDALVVRQMKPDARIICATNLGNIGAIVLPAAARELVVVCDRDDKPAAQDALERALAQQQARGLTVRIVMPPAPHKDLNDWLRAGLGAGQRSGQNAGGKAA